jgi:hypothetical protein
MSLPLLSENEARRKWCPFARGSPDDKCLGSGCMAWSWATTATESSAFNSGYCGLAGGARPDETPPSQASVPVLGYIA